MSALVLSLFPGAGLLDLAFHETGFCCVRGPEWIFGQDVREFHPPSGRFDGIIGGDPCQSHSALANLVRAKGLEPSFPDMTPEFARVIEEARPAWFLRENVPRAPDIKPAGYDVRSFVLCNSTLDSGDGWGNEQMRRRRFWFGVREGECPELRKWIPFALFELSEAEQTVSADSRAVAVAVAVGGSGKRKVTAVGGNDGTADAINGYRKARAKVPPVPSLTRCPWRPSVATDGTVEGGFRARQAAGNGRHEGAVGTPEIDYSPPRRSLGEMLRLQGLPEDWMDRQPWTQQAKRKMVGNGVSLHTGRVLAGAIIRWLETAS